MHNLHCHTSYVFKCILKILQKQEQKKTKQNLTIKKTNENYEKNKEKKNKQKKIRSNTRG